MLPDGLLERLKREAGVDDLLGALGTRLAPSDLQSLLLRVYAALARRVSPGRLLAQYERDRFVRPSVVDPRVALQLDVLAFNLLPSGYQPLELSPLAPLGTCSAVGTVHQNKVVSTSRNTEVVSDSTNVLALEASVRRRGQRGQPRGGQPVLLATSARLSRAQALPGPGSWAHFRLFSLVAAHRDQGTMVFESEQLVEQLSFYLRLFEALNAKGWAIQRPRIALTDVTDGRLSGVLEERVLEPLRTAFPSVTMAMDPSRKSGLGYYANVCFKLFVQRDDGPELEIGDGGDVEWTCKLLSDAKERTVISALGSERLSADRSWAG